MLVIDIEVRYQFLYPFILLKLFISWISFVIRILRVIYLQNPLSSNQETSASSFHICIPFLSSSWLITVAMTSTSALKGMEGVETLVLFLVLVEYTMSISKQDVYIIYSQAQVKLSRTEKKENRSWGLGKRAMQLAVLYSLDPFDSLVDPPPSSQRIRHGGLILTHKCQTLARLVS